jgi:AsmA protein
MKKRWVKVVIAIAVVVIVVFGLIPLFINVDAFRPKVEDEITSALGRKITLGHLDLSLITGSLVADNISVADDPAFATEPFLEAKKLHVGIALGQLLLHHQVQITSFIVDSPAIHLIHARNGTWNFSSLGSAATQPAPQESAPQQESMLSSVSIGEVKIKNGSAMLSSIPEAGKPFTCTEINLSMQQLSMTTQFPFKLSLKLPGGGSFQLSGTAGPVAANDVSKTPFKATLQLKHFNPATAGAVEPGLGVSMIADFNAQLGSDGTNLISNGKLVATKLQLARGGSPAPQPVNIDYTISNNLETRTGRVSDIEIHTGSASAHVKGSFRFTEKATELDLHFSAPNLPIDQLEQMLPAAGINLPSGSKLKGGTLTANLTITGPANAVVISGSVEIDNTELTGFDLGSKIEGLSPFKSKTGGTAIEKLSADLISSTQFTQLSNIYGSVPTVGTATGNGTVSSSNALDFNLDAKLKDSSVVGALANGGTRAMRFIGSGARSAANNGIPITITGTASNPTIKVETGSMFKGQTGEAAGNTAGQQNAKPAKARKGLFHKK